MVTRMTVHRNVEALVDSSLTVIVPEILQKTQNAAAFLASVPLGFHLSRALIQDLTRPSRY